MKSRCYGVISATFTEDCCLIQVFLKAKKTPKQQTPLLFFGPPFCLRHLQLILELSLFLSIVLSTSQPTILPSLSLHAGVQMSLELRKLPTEFGLFQTLDFTEFRGQLNAAQKSHQLNDDVRRYVVYAHTHQYWGIFSMHYSPLTDWWVCFSLCS